MNFLAGLIGGAAQTGANILERENKADYENSLAIKRQVEIEKLQEKRAAALLAQKRAQDVTDAKTVQEGAKQIDTDRSIGLINATVGPVPTPAVNEIDGTTNEFAGKKMTAADIETIRNNMSPEDAKKFYGIGPLNRVQQAEDSGVAARNAGLLGMSKEFRAEAGEYRQQNLEAAKVVHMEDQTREQKRANDIKEAEGERREKDSIRRENVGIYKADQIFAAAEVRANKESTAKEKSEATLNLNTSVTTQSNLIKQKQEALMGLDEKKDAQKILDIKAEIKEAEDIQKLAQKALKGTLEDGNFKREEKRSPQPKKPKGITKAEYDKLPSGSSFTAPDGSRRIKP